MKSSIKHLLPLTTVLLLFSQLVLADIRVHNQDEFRKAVKNAVPGDTIVLANGEWRDFEILLLGTGTMEKPITLTAETKGKVIITGRSNLRMAGEHLVVSGLVFRDGYTPTNTVLSFRRSSTELANHSRITEVVVDHFNNPERFEEDYWVMMYGRNNRFDHNYLAGKSNKGVTMAVRLDQEASRNNHHRIDHNYFGPRPVLGSNGGETLRIGTSAYSLTDSYTVVEDNYFDRCDGEVEIISSKSGNNSFRRNVFFESRGTLTLRHGNDNRVEDNVFFGNGVDHTGGIRVINKRQTVRNNYLTGLTGSRFGGALVIMNGVPDSPINRYHQVEDSIVEHNTIIDSDHIELAAGSDDERSATPLRTSFRNNLIVNETPKDSIAVYDDISGIEFDGNVASGVQELPAKKGFTEQSVQLEEANNGLRYPAGLDAGASRSLAPIDRAATGPDWYPKPGYESRFASGATIAVEPGLDTLSTAVANAGAGDVLELAAGEYVVTRFIRLDRPLTIRALAGAATKPRLRFERTSLFELVDGGSLQLQNLAIDGSLAPDAYDNSVIRTSRYSMLGNYEIDIRDVDVSDLDTNHSFHFIKVASHTFADTVSIVDSSFSDVSGSILSHNRETDDLGIYNGEYVNILTSTFRNIGGTVANLYRGGTDESTFGPHFRLLGNEFDNVGNDKRNKSRASVYLLGVQLAEIKDNRFKASAPLRVVTTVGEPVTVIADNHYDDTHAPVVKDIKELERP